MKSRLKDRFFWYIAILVSLVGLLAVLDGINLSGGQWHDLFIPVQRLAFVLGVMIASWRFGARTGWLAGGIMGAFILAKYIFPPELFITRIASFNFLIELGMVAFGGIASWFIGKYREAGLNLRMSENNLKMALKEWTETFNSIADPILILGLEQKILRGNQACEKAFGVKLEQTIGKPCYHVVHSTPEPVPGCPHLEMVKTGKTCSLEYIEPATESIYEITASPVLDENRKIIASVHIFRNITESKKLQERMIITDRMASLGEMAAGIAHEINNPLTGVLGFAELVRERALPGDIKADIEIIYQEAQRTAKVVRNMLTFARRQAHAVEAIDLNALITKTLEFRKHDHKTANIEVTCSLEPEAGILIADCSQIQQVLLNLILNAEYSMKKAHNGGNLRVTTRRHNGFVRLTVADDGLGIDKGTAGKLFNPFFTTKPEGEGTGLGLAICHGIIKSHKGRVWVESEPGRGATFFVELPLAG